MNDSIESILNISLDRIKMLANANTIVGSPINMPDGITTIIPISKVGLGLLSGGLEIPTNSPIKKSAQDVAEYPFGGTSAVGIGLSPTAFIIITNGNARIEPVEYKSSIDRLIDTLVPIADKVVNKLINKDE